MSKDVNHSFNIHDYVVLMDAIPGRVNTVWFAPDAVGEHDIQCREYCGLIHYNMRGTLIWRIHHIDNLDNAFIPNYFRGD